MQAPFSRSRVYVFLQLSTIAIFIVYLVFQLLAPQLSPDVDLNLTLNSRTCSSVTVRFASPSFGSSSPETIQLLELSPIPSTHSVSLTPTTQTVMVEPCPAGDLTSTALSLSSSQGSIDYALEQGDLQCYGCQLLKRMDGSVSISNSSTQPALVINNIHKRAPFLLPTIFRPGRYLPPLLFLCLFLIFLFPVITSSSCPSPGP